MRWYHRPLNATRRYQGNLLGWACDTVNRWDETTFKQIVVYLAGVITGLVISVIVWSL